MLFYTLPCQTDKAWATCRHIVSRTMPYKSITFQNPLYADRQAGTWTACQSCSDTFLTTPWRPPCLAQIPCSPTACISNIYGEGFGDSLLLSAALEDLASQPPRLDLAHITSRILSLYPTWVCAFPAWLHIYFARLLTVPHASLLQHDWGRCCLDVKFQT